MFILKNVMVRYTFTCLSKEPVWFKYAQTLYIGDNSIRDSTISKAIIIMDFMFTLYLFFLSIDDLIQ